MTIIDVALVAATVSGIALIMICLAARLAGYEFERGRIQARKDAAGEGGR